jgi:hypothetical protein
MPPYIDENVSIKYCLFRTALLAIGIILEICFL